MAHLFDNQLQRRVNGARGIVIPFDVDSLRHQRQNLAAARNREANKKLQAARKVGYQPTPRTFLQNCWLFIKAFAAI
jgi:hypothetical protein